MIDFLLVKIHLSCFGRFVKIGPGKMERLVDVYRKNKKIVEFNKKHVFKTFTIDKLDIGDIISNITMIFLRLGNRFWE